MTNELKHHYLIEVDNTSFSAHIQRAESTFKAGAVAIFFEEGGGTTWSFAGQVVGLTQGPTERPDRSWLIVGLTSAQHRLVVDQLCNND